MKVQVTSRRAEVEAELDEGIKKALTMIGQQAMGYASMTVPVQTGRLRGSISYATEEAYGNAGAHKAEDSAMHANPSSGQVVIGTNVVYAPVIEFRGGKLRRGQHYLRNAISDHVDQYLAMVKAVLSAGN